MKFTFIRYATYAILTFILLEIMRFDANDVTQAVKFSETSFVERLQNIFLIISILFIARVKEFIALKYGLLLIFGLFFIREQDAFLDTLIGKHAWKIICSVYGIAIIYKIYNYRANLKDDLEKFLNTSSSGILFIGLTTLLIFSRMFGRKIFWIAVEGTNDYTRNVKNAAEECTELFAYFLLCIGAIEFFVFSITHVKKLSFSSKKN